MIPTSQLIISLREEQANYNKIMLRLDKASDSLWEADRMTKAANIHLDGIRELINDRRKAIITAIERAEKEQA